MRPRTLDEVVGPGAPAGRGPPLRRLVGAARTADRPDVVILWGRPAPARPRSPTLVRQRTGAPVRRAVRGHRRRQGGARGDRRRPRRARHAADARPCCSSTRSTASPRPSRTRCCPAVENRWVTLVAATTENPFFSRDLPAAVALAAAHPGAADRRRRPRGPATGPSPTSAGSAARVTLAEDAERPPGPDGRRRRPAGADQPRGGRRGRAGRRRPHGRPGHRRAGRRPGGGPLRPATATSTTT